MQKDHINYSQFFNTKQKKSDSINNRDGKDKNEIKNNKWDKSSLYNTLLLLIQKNDTDISNLVITQNAHKEVFYIDLDKPTNSQLFSDYNFKESHLTIHKYYQSTLSTHRHNLSMAHYTETYTNSNNSKIVVHVFFNNLGAYQYAQIKNYPDKKNKDHFKAIEVNSFIEESLRINSDNAKTKLQMLLNKNEEFRNQFFSKAEELDAQLDEISKNLHSDAINSYIKTGEVFIETINSLNKHLDKVYDKRGIVMEEQLRSLRNSLLETTVSKQPDTDLDDTQNSTLPIVTPENKITSTQEHPIYTELKKLSEQLKLIDKKLKSNPNDIESLLGQHETLNTIKLKLLEFSFWMSSFKGPYRDLINNLQARIAKQKDILSIFKNEFWQGNLEAVKSLYPHIEQQISMDFILHDIIFELLNKKPKSDLATKIEAVFAFLRHSSAIYRYIINPQAQFMWSDKNRRYATSILIKACESNNLFAFELLLKQGMNPNALGAIIDSLQVPAFYLITLHAHSCKKIKYMKLALEFGAHYSVELASFRSNIKRIGLTQSSTELSSTIKTKTDEDALYFLSNYKSLVTACLNDNYFNELEILVPQLSLEDTVYALASLISAGSIHHMNFPSQELCIYFAENHNQALNSIRKLAKYDEYFAITLYPNKNELATKLGMSLFKALKEKITLCQNPEFLISLVNKFTDHIASRIKNADPHSLTGVWEYDACLLLIMLNEKKDEKAHYMSLQHMMTLYCKQASCVKNYCKKNQEQFIDFYLMTMMIGSRTKFAEKLKDTPIFKFVIQQLNSNIKLVPQDKITQLKELTDEITQKEQLTKNCP